MFLIDVRSPSEFKQGHVPGSISHPLFDDEERHRIGLCYAEKGPEEAVRLGLSLFGPKMSTWVNHVDQLLGGEKQLEVYCWRGGMRSGSAAWLLSTAGYRVHRWEGGYKAYRHRVLSEIAQHRPYCVLTGKTGTGKTELLASLRESGIQVVDLEKIANHRGSAFGHVGLDDQPTTEQFENELAQALEGLSNDAPIWVEDESQSIGKIWLQPSLFQQLQAAPRLEIHRSLEDRANHLARIYGRAPQDQLKASFTKLTRKIGGQWIPVAHEAIDEGRLADAALLALRYYDKTYAHSMAKTEHTVKAHLDLSGLTPEDAALRAVDAVRNFSTPS